MYLGVEVISELQPVEVGGQVFNMGDVDEGLRERTIGIRRIELVVYIDGC